MGKLTKIQKKEAILAGLSFVFFIFMLVHRLAYSAPWGDEWVEYEYSQKVITSGELYKAIISTFQPPLYNFLMHFWLKFGSSVLWFRSFNVILGVIAGIYVYKTQKKLYGYKAAALTIVFFASCYQWIFCVQECSEYGLMLMFLTAALYYFVSARMSNKRFHGIAFIISCVGAMYSQYGAVFVVAPLLGIYFVEVCISKEKRRIIFTSVSYLCTLLIAAAPLYFFFAKIQMKQNAISEHTTIQLSGEIIKGFFTEIGILLGYFWNFSPNPYMDILLKVFGLIFLAVLIAVIGMSMKRKKALIADILIAFLIGYCLNYFLVVFHIYAMVHPNESAGFLDRYSYFYIPFLMIVIPVMIGELRKFAADKKLIGLQLSSGFILGALFMLVIPVSLPKILTNWHKTYDDVFAEKWMEEEGYNDVTFQIGLAYYGFNYYVINQNPDIDLSGKVLGDWEINYDDLPETFWLWRTGWGGADFYQIVDSVKQKGYHVNIIQDSGYSGQLAKCTIRDTQ